jgi:predicted glutamine amidotransferase
MCRWLAYVGPPIDMSLLLIKPKHSLLVQSLHASLNDLPTNGDGFGIGWYTDKAEPGIYRDIRPAWNDSNLNNLAEQTRSRMFMGHVRAATGTAIQRTNCHPFRHGRWLFQHNGLVPDYPKIRRQMMFEVDPELFNSIEGSTDSELMFYLALTYGLELDPPGALERLVGRIEQLRQEMGIEKALQFSVAVANGERLYAVRYSSCNESRSLFYTRDFDVLRDYDTNLAEIPPGSIVVVSEPLGPAVAWTEVEESSLIIAEESGVEIKAFKAA